MEVSNLPRVTELEWVTAGSNSKTLSTVLYNLLKQLSPPWFCAVSHFRPASHAPTRPSFCLALLLALQGHKKPVKRTERGTLFYLGTGSWGKGVEVVNWKTPTSISRNPISWQTRSHRVTSENISIIMKDINWHEFIYSEVKVIILLFGEN